jgi:hypothetical protein
MAFSIEEYDGMEMRSVKYSKGNDYLYINTNTLLSFLKENNPNDGSSWDAAFTFIEDNIKEK